MKVHIVDVGNASEDELKRVLQGVDLIESLEALSYLKTLGVGWTEINVGWWMQLSVPYPTGFVDNANIQKVNRVYGNDTKPP